MNKQVGFWQEIVQILQVFQNTTFVGVFMGFFVAILRSFFTKDKNSLCYKIVDGLICGALTLSAIPFLKYFGLNEEFAIFLGSMIGFIGTEKIRELTLKITVMLLNKISNKGNHNG